MKKLFKGLGMGLASSALIMGLGAAQALATTTLGVGVITETGGLVITGAVGSAMTFATTATTGDITIGGTGQTSGTTLIYGGTDTGTGTAAGLSLTPGTAGTLVLGAAAGTGAVSLGTSSADQTVNVAQGTAVKTINIGTANTYGVTIIGGTAGTGAITLGSSTGGQTVNVGTGNSGGADVLNLGTGTAVTSKTVNVATGAISFVNVGTGDFVNTIKIGDHATPANVITIGGAASTTTVKGTLTVGVDDTGHDVTFFGATTGKSFLWDESADKMIVTGTSTLAGDVAVTGSATFTNGTAVLGDTGTNTSNCTGANNVTFPLATGNFFSIDMEDASDCSITFSGGVAGAIVVIQLEYSGTDNFTFADTTPQVELIEQVCADSAGAEPDANGDIVTLTIRMLDATSPQVLACTQTSV